MSSNDGLMLGILKILVNISEAITRQAERAVLGREAARAEHGTVLEEVKRIGAKVDGLGGQVQALQTAVERVHGQAPHPTASEAVKPAHAPPIPPAVLPVTTLSPSPWAVALAFVQQPQGMAALCAVLLALAALITGLAVRDRREPEPEEYAQPEPAKTGALDLDERALVHSGEEEG